MDSRHNKQDDERDRERFGSLPVLRDWWTELSGPAKVLIPTTALILVFVGATSVPPFVF